MTPLVVHYCPFPHGCDPAWSLLERESTLPLVGGRHLQKPWNIRLAGRLLQHVS